MNPQNTPSHPETVVTSLPERAAGAGFGPDLFEIDLFRQARIRPAAGEDLPEAVPPARSRRTDEHPKA